MNTYNVLCKQKQLEQFKQDIKQRLEDNIIRLRDTRGNFSMGIRLPNKDYKPTISKEERRKRYGREYAQICSKILCYCKTPHTRI
jgi:hypothetical protein